MGTVRGGYLDKFTNDLKGLVEKEVSFQVVSSGLTRKILFPVKDEKPHKRLYYGNKKDDILPGVHMVNAVRRNVDAYIENGGEIPKIEFKPKLILYNFEQIDKALTKSPVDLTFAIDINACFFRTAFNLGYITESLYLKGWEKRKKNKLGLLASIGSLNKHETIQEYKNGVLDKEYMNWEQHRHIVEEILDKHGYDYKDFYIEFEGLNPKEVKWYDFKSREKKYINHNILLNYYKGFTPFIKLTNLQRYGSIRNI